jgi:hypothetical protein
MGDVINFYELEKVKNFGVQYHTSNPNYNFENMPLKHPMRLFSYMWL